MSTSFQSAITYLEQFAQPGGFYTLERMRQMMTLLGNPERKLPCIHIGGTAGKGSTAHMIAAILEEAGYRVGLHTSPHLVSVRERFLMNRKMITEFDFVTILETIKPVIVKIHPTYYEIVIAMMFMYFVQKKVDIAVIEVGLGGRLDATNIIPPPLVSVLTNVGLDHMQILGNTTMKIAADKKEIIKENSVAVSAVTQLSIRNMLMSHCKRKNTKLYLYGSDFFLPDIRISLQGQHQKVNAACAIKAVSVCGLSVKEHHIRQALSQISIPGRLASVQNILIDGAHNPMKIRALSNALHDYYPDKKFNTLIAVKKDKNAAAMVRALKPHVRHWYLATVNKTTDWGPNPMIAPDILKEIICSVDSTKPVTLISDTVSFLKTTPDILITGSLYLVGDIYEILGTI